MAAAPLDERDIHQSSAPTFKGCRMADDTYDDGVEEFRALITTMTEDEVRLRTRALLPTVGERLLFDEVTCGGTKPDLDLVAAQSRVRVRIYGP